METSFANIVERRMRIVLKAEEKKKGESQRFGELST